jgi:cobalamin biosynthetic protein CobC
MLEHGGRQREAARRYGIAEGAWLDLSTGINPLGYPVPVLDPASWRRLTEEDDDLSAAAERYYGAANCLPVPGTQALLQVLPRIIRASRVAVLAPTYEEHGAAWARAGRAVSRVPEKDLEKAALTADALVVCNPNNPDCAVLASDRLLALQRSLAARGGWLIVDEAFADGFAAASVAAHSGVAGLAVMRSMGKFFGLAGMRLGFALGPEALLDAIREELGPWAVNGPARQVAQRALRDAAWQDNTRARLQADIRRLNDLLSRHGLRPVGSTLLYSWLPVPDARRFQDRLAQQGIWVRDFDDPPGVRFGLPGREQDWMRLDRALSQVWHEA